VETRNNVNTISDTSFLTILFSVGKTAPRNLRTMNRAILSKRICWCTLI